MEKTQLGNVTLFKEEFLGGLSTHELYGTSNETGNWVSFNDICGLLCYNKNKKKRMKKYLNESDLCSISFKRVDSFENDIENE